MRDLQFSINYLPTEDRLVLKGAFPDSTEVQLWLTRRLTQGLLGAIEQYSTHVVSSAIADPGLKAQVASFTREAAVEQSNYGQPYQQGKLHPLMGAGPRLVTTVNLKPQENDRVAVTLILDKGERLNFALPNSGLFALLHLIQQAAEKAGWALGIATPAQRPAKVN